MENLGPLISAETLGGMLDEPNLRIADVRWFLGDENCGRAEYAAGHIPGAVNIPFDQVAARIREVEAPHGVALYCMVGPRARRGEAALLTSGYESVFHIEGGLAAWEAGGLPVERAP